MSILLTGGTGKTSIRLARLLQAAGKRTILASRKADAPAPFTAVKFDWHDPTTFENPFAVDPKIESVYLISPAGVADVFGPMKPFIDLAVKKGVKRFVLLSASSIEPGGKATGLVHEYLVKLGVDYFVIRPTWFQDNFVTSHVTGIKEKNTILSASQDGKIGFIAADDIAELAFDALTRAESYNTDKILLGPELLSYDDVAKIFSDVLGRTITHTRVSADELKKIYQSFGLSEEYAGILSFLETLNAAGVEEKTFANPNKATGKTDLRSFVEANKAVWQV